MPGTLLLAGLPISIHAPREGCDSRTPRVWCGLEISIHAPREGCDDNATVTVTKALEFQSTHPVRGATLLRYGREAW